MKTLCVVLSLIWLSSIAMGGPISDALISEGFITNDGSHFIFIDPKRATTEIIDIQPGTPSKIYYHVKHDLLHKSAFLIGHIEDEKIMAENIVHNLCVIRLNTLKIMMCGNSGIPDAQAHGELDAKLQ